MKKIFLSLSLIVLLVVNSAGFAFAAETDVDSSFITGGGFTSVTDRYVKHIVQPDGKILVYGEFNTYKGVLKNGIVRLNQNGSIDETFVTGSGFDREITAMALQDDGKIIVGGRFSEYSGVEVPNIIRLDANGSLDTSFDTGEGFSDNTYPGEINTIIFQSNDSVPSESKILVGGSFDEYNNSSIGANLAVLTLDGTLDTGFDSGTGFDRSVTAIALQPDGKILVGGSFNEFNGVDAGYIIRLDADGVRDTDFDTNIGTGFNNEVSTIALQSGGDILVGGYFSEFNNIAAGYIIRLDGDGVRDTTFDTNIGTGFADGGAEGYDTTINKIFVTSTGEIIVAGFFGSLDSTPVNNIVVLNDGGTVFSTLGTGSNAQVFSVSEYNNSFVFSGFTKNFNTSSVNLLFRLSSDYLLDNTLDTGAGFKQSSGSSADIVTPYLLGKVLVVSEGNMYDGNPVKQMVRLNANGSLDTTFTITGNGFINQGDPAQLYTVVTQSDGKILVGGNFSEYGGVAVKYIARLNANGSLDTDFNPLQKELSGGFGNVRVEKITLQSDGKILVGGNFTEYDSQTAGRIIRLNADGSLDEAFNVGGEGLDGLVRDIALGSDGSIIVTGLFSTYNQLSSKNIVKLTPAGAYDNTFVAEGDFTFGFDGSINNVVIQSDGSLVVGGYFTEYNGESVGGVLRFTPTGTLDTTFNLGGAGFEGPVFNILSAGNDKIFAVGPFAKYNGVTVANLIRINADGTLDTSFDTGAGFDQSVRSVAIESNGKILMGGDFTSYNNTPANSIIRLMGSYVAPVTPDPTPEKPRTRVVGGGGSSRASVTTPVAPTPSTDTTDCKVGDMFSATTGARCGGSTTPNTPTTPTTTPSNTSFTKSLKQGMTDPEVKLLQQYLNSKGFTIAPTGPGSKGMETSFFGPATKAAVIKFQLANNITPAVGFFGPVTRGSVK